MEQNGGQAGNGCQKRMKDCMDNRKRSVPSLQFEPAEQQLKAQLT